MPTRLNSFLKGRNDAAPFVAKPLLNLLQFSRIHKTLKLLQTVINQRYKTYKKNYLTRLASSVPKGVNLAIFFDTTVPLEIKRGRCEEKAFFKKRN